jgi:hypothetical protein
MESDILYYENETRDKEEQVNKMIEEFEQIGKEINELENKYRSKFSIKKDTMTLKLGPQPKSFFPEIGDKMINDEFQVKFNVLAVKP